MLKCLEDLRELDEVRKEPLKFRTLEDFLKESTPVERTESDGMEKRYT